MFDIERDQVVDVDMKPALGVMISCADFKPVYDGLHTSKEESSESHTSPLSKKRRIDHAKPHLKETSNTIEVKLIGMGPEVVEGALRADLNIKLVLKY
jgi:hypothetical protein